MSWFKDSSGTEFTTVDGKPPSGANVPITIANGTGQLGNGTWTGTAAVPNK